MISSFTKQYAFLSNFYPCKIKLDDGLVYPSVEHSYQASKTLNIHDRNFIRLALKASSAKHMGSHLPLRPDWEKMKLQVMYEILTKKFSDPDLRAKLLSTGEEVLIEGNWWGDDYWGVPQGPLYQGQGQNHLGKLLMRVRNELREEKENENRSAVPVSQVERERD